MAEDINRRLCIAAVGTLMLSVWCLPRAAIRTSVFARLHCLHASFDVFHIPPEDQTAQRGGVTLKGHSVGNYGEWGSDPSSRRTPLKALSRVSSLSKRGKRIDNRAILTQPGSHARNVLLLAHTISHTFPRPAGWQSPKQRWNSNVFQSRLPDGYSARFIRQ